MIISVVLVLEGVMGQDAGAIDEDGGDLVEVAEAVAAELQWRG